jgi:hypothetical protein
MIEKVKDEKIQSRRLVFAQSYVYERFFFISQNRLDGGPEPQNSSPA